MNESAENLHCVVQGGGEGGGVQRKFLSKHSSILLKMSRVLNKNRKGVWICLVGIYIILNIFIYTIHMYVWVNCKFFRQHFFLILQTYVDTCTYYRIYSPTSLSSPLLNFAHLPFNFCKIFLPSPFLVPL